MDFSKYVKGISIIVLNMFVVIVFSGDERGNDDTERFKQEEFYFMV